MTLVVVIIKGVVLSLMTVVSVTVVESVRVILSVVTTVVSVVTTVVSVVTTVVSVVTVVASGVVVVVSVLLMTFTMKLNMRKPQMKKIFIVVFVIFFSLKTK